MTFEEVRKKSKSRFWWILISILVLNLLSWSWISELRYNSLVSFRLELNKQFYEITNFSSKLSTNVIINENSLASSYNQNSVFLSKYFQEFLLSGSAIQKLKDNGGISANASIDKPTYTISSLGNAVIEIRNEFNSESEAQKFNDSLIGVIENEVKDWNQDKPEMLKLDSASPQGRIVVKSKPLQLKLLPSLAGLVLGVTLVLLTPLNLIKNIKKQAK